MKFVLMLLFCVAYVGNVHAVDCEVNPEECVEMPDMTSEGISNWMDPDEIAWYIFYYSDLGNGNGQNYNGGQSNADAAKEKLDYCRAKDKLVAILSAAKITGTIMTGLSIAQGSVDGASIFFNSGLQDIRINLATGDHVGTYLNALMNWHEADINWVVYVPGWNQIAPPQLDSNGNVMRDSNGNQIPQGPSWQNGGYKHIFALHLKTLGLGSGVTSNATAESAASDLLKNSDPDPNTPCP